MYVQAVTARAKAYPWQLSILPGALFATALLCYQLSLTNVLFGVYDYDDGVYFGSAVRLVHGAVPYRDYVFVHPPGIAVILAPIALLGDAIGTRDALGVARCLTALVTVANVVLAGVALRRRGAVASFVASAALACFPLVVAADNTVLLEPFLALFCLVGVVLIFGGPAEPKFGRIFVGGIALGLAGSVKIWAIFPVVAALAFLVPRRRELVGGLGGIVVGFAAVCGPFFAMAPKAFAHEVVVAQLTRHATTASAQSLGGRLLDLTGLSGISAFAATSRVAVLWAAAIVVVVVVAYALNLRRLTRLEGFVLGASALSVASVLVSREYYTYYSYFPTIFVALLLGVVASLLARSLGQTFVAHTSNRRARSRAALIVGLVSAIGAVLFAVQACTFAREFIASSPMSDEQVIDANVPAGSCVVFDEPSLALGANRFVANASCPQVVDPFGTWMSADPSSPPPAVGPYPAALIASWKSWFARADYVVLAAPESNVIPWGGGDLLAQFNKSYRLAASGPRAYVYVHVGRSTT